MRSIKNFINLPKSLSIKHERYQSYARLGSDIRSDLQYGVGSEFQINIYNVAIQQAIKQVLSSENLQEYEKVTVKGTEYTKGSVFLASQTKYQTDIVFGKIRLSLSDESGNCHALFEILESNFVPYLRAYEIGRAVVYQCCHLNTLLHFKPMWKYNLGPMRCIKPSHGFVGCKL